MLAAPPALLERRPELPPALEQVVARALAKKPEERFASVSEFVTALLATPEAPPEPLALPTPPRTPRPVRPPSTTPGISKSGKIATLGGNKRTPTSPLPSVSGKRTPTSPIPSVHSAHPTTSPFAPPISLERAYEIFCAQVEDNESAELLTGALIIHMPPEQVGQRVYLQSQRTWLTLPYRLQYEAQVYRRAVQGHSLIAAVFRGIAADDYFVWTNRQEPVPLEIIPGKATLLDFTGSTPVLVTSKEAEPPPSREQQRQIAGIFVLGLAALGALFGGLLGLLTGYTLAGALLGALALTAIALLRIKGAAQEK
jgi:hypothetical protein